MDTDIFIGQIKGEHIHVNVVKDVETKFCLSNYKLDRPLTREKIKKEIGLIAKFVTLRTKTYSY